MTLIELLIALVIGSILTAALYRTFIRQQKTYAVQDQVVEAQQSVRIAMEIIARNVRMAGYNPTGTTNPNFGFQTATANQIIFTADLDGEGDLDGNETIGFRLSGTSLDRLVTGQWHSIAENIASLQFQYFDGNGNPTTVLQNIRAVRVTIRARTSMADPEYGSGGGYRTRELSSHIHVRNLGL